MLDDETIEIGGKRLGTGYAPLIIAELSGNHDGSLDKAHRIVDAAADAGADALKLQTYTADTLTIDSNEQGFVIEDSSSPWEGRNLYSLYKEAYTPWEWHHELFEHARERGLICFSSPFDVSAVNFLENLDCPAYKIASFENNDLELIEKAAATGKPLIISTGVSDVATIRDAVTTARKAGCNQLLLLKCTSSYPADPTNSNLKTIPHMRDLFGCPVGLSDHTLGIGVPVASVALGAVAIEKHVTLDRQEGGVDAAFSLTPQELRLLVTETRRAWQAIGTIQYGASDLEEKSLGFKRSLYVVQDIKEGERLGRENVRAIRPGYGIAPKHLDAVLGMTAKKDIARGTPLSWDLLR